MRLHDVDTDLLISLNVPLKSTENRIDLNSIWVPVPSPEGLEDEDLGSSCLGRGCSFLLEGLKTDNIISSTDQPSISGMLCTEVSTYVLEVLLVHTHCSLIDRNIIVIAINIIIIIDLYHY